MITAIYFRDREIKPYGRVGDIFVVGDKKYRVIAKDNPNYDSYYVRGDEAKKYLWGFEEIKETMPNEAEND